MADTIDKVQVEVEATAKGTSLVFKQLEQQLTVIKQAMQSIDTSKLNAINKVNTSGMSRAEKDISSSVDKIKQALAGLNSYKNAALGGDSSALTSFQRRVTSIQSAIDTLTEKLKQADDNRLRVNIDSDALQTYREQLAEIEQMFKETQSEVNSAMGEMQNEKPEIDTSKFSDSMNTIKQKASSVLKAVKRMASGIASAFATAGKGIKSVSARMLGVSGGLDKTTSAFKKNLWQIIKYGFGVRSLYVLFRRLRKAVTESFTELQKSGAMWQTTKANVEGLKTALSTLKFQFGAAFEPLFNVVAPALTSFINYLISLMNTISAFIAKLTGRSTYSKVAQVMNNTASSAGSAGKATKELNKQLQAFDELNNISPENNSGGGGSGGSGGGSTGATYTEESVESALGDFASALADKIKEGDWKGVGTAISGKLTEVLNDIPWNKIFKSADQFGRNLADFLNGLITPDLFEALGTTIGNAIKTKLTFLNSLGDELDFPNLGHSIASAISGFVNTHPLPLMATTFSTWATGITSALATAIRDMLDNGTIDTISQDITTALENLEIGEIAWNVGQIVSGLANSIYVLVSNKETWKQLGTKIGDGISNFFKSMNQTNSKTGLTGWQALGKDISNTISGIADALTEALDTVSWTDVGQAIADFISSIDWGSLFWDLVELAEAALGALVDAIKGFWNNATWQEKVGAVIVGMIAVAKLTGITSTISSLLTKSLGNTTIGATVGKIMLLATSVSVMGINEDDGTAASLGRNVKNDVAGAAGAYGAMRLLGVSNSIALPITAVALSWEIGTDVGSYLGQKWVDLLADKGVISREGADEYIRISRDRGVFGWKWWVDIAEASFETDKDGENRIKVAWQEFQYRITELITGEDQHFQGGGKSFNTLTKDYADAYITPLVDAIKEKAKEETEKLAPFIQKYFGDAFEKIASYVQHPWKAQEGVNYEYDDKGNIKYAYENKNKDDAYTMALEYTLKFKFLKKELTYEEFTAVMALLDALKNLPTFNKTSTYNVKVNGDSSSKSKRKPTEEVEGLTEAFKGLAESIESKSAEYGIDVTGDASNRDDIDKLSDSMFGLRQNWKDKDAKLNVKSSAEGTEGKGVKALQNLGDKFLEVYGNWKDKDAKFTAKLEGAQTVKDALDKLAGDRTANFNVQYGSNVSKSSEGYQTYCSMYDNWQNATATFDIQFSVNNSGNLMSAVNNMCTQINEALASSGAKGRVNTSAVLAPFSKLATGGVIDKAMFALIGEAGTEAVVPLEHNTGWLTKMSDMLITGMENSATFGAFATPPRVNYNGYASDAYASNSNTEYYIAEQNRLIQREIDLLEQILEKPSGITSGEVFRAVRGEARNFYQRTGNGAFNS